MLYEVIQRVPLSTVSYDDKWVWNFGMEGMSLTKPAYHFLMLPKMSENVWLPLEGLEEAMVAVCLTERQNFWLEVVAPTASHNLLPGQV